MCDCDKQLSRMRFIDAALFADFLIGIAVGNVELKSI
jgi:hypothetical protein